MNTIPEIKTSQIWQLQTELYLYINNQKCYTVNSNEITLQVKITKKEEAEFNKERRSE